MRGFIGRSSLTSPGIPSLDELSGPIEDVLEIDILIPAGQVSVDIPLGQTVDVDRTGCLFLGTPLTGNTAYEKTKTRIDLKNSTNLRARMGVAGAADVTGKAQVIIFRTGIYKPILRGDITIAATNISAPVALARTINRRKTQLIKLGNTTDDNTGNAAEGECAIYFVSDTELVGEKNNPTKTDIISYEIWESLL